jgi:hypothetical protein
MALAPLSRGSSLTLCILDETCGKPPVRAKNQEKGMRSYDRKEETNTDRHLAVLVASRGYSGFEPLE